MIRMELKMNRWMVVGEYQGITVEIVNANCAEWVSEFILTEIWDGTRRSNPQLNYVAYLLEG